MALSRNSYFVFKKIICYTEKDILECMALLGDTVVRGCVTSLKLSPNLRRVSKPEVGSVEEAEAAKLSRVIEVALKGDVGGGRDWDG
jgi:hypothetical protein